MPPPWVADGSGRGRRAGPVGRRVVVAGRPIIDARSSGVDVAQGDEGEDRDTDGDHQAEGGAGEGPAGDPEERWAEDEHPGALRERREDADRSERRGADEEQPPPADPADDFATASPSPWQRLLQEVSGLARPGTPPEPDRAADGSSAGVRLPAALDRSDVADAVSRCLLGAPTEPGRTIRCAADAIREPSLATVDAIARLALSARRSRQGFRLEHASPALLDLIALCGLSDSVGLGRGVRDPR
jgi:hypothetical protein